MPRRADRVIIDTNLWVSFLISRNFSRFDRILFSKQAVLLFSQELLDEFISVTSRPKLRKFFLSKDLIELIATINEFAVFIEVKTPIDICRDKKDNFLLSLAIDGQADYLLTGDNDLLDLKKIGKTKIATITTYLKKNLG